MLSALGAAVYLPLAASGYRLSGSFDQFRLANLVLVTALAGAGSALAVGAMRALLQVTTLRPWLADLAALGGGVSTLLLTYGVTFNNHALAAGTVTAALALVLLENPTRPRSLTRRRFGAGLLAGLAATMDLPMGCAMLAALGVWLMVRARSVPWAYLLGAAGPLLLHVVLQSQVTGSPLPAEMYPDAFNYPGSYWLSDQGRWVEHGPRWRFGLEFLVGPQGWLTVTPALVFGLIGLAWAALRRGDPLRPAAWVIGGVLAVVVAYYVWGVRRTDFAGHSFGTRHLLAITPLVYVFAIVALDRLRCWPVSLLFALLMGVGLVYAFAGMREPWKRIENRRDPAVRLLQRFVVYPRSTFPPTPGAKP